MNIGSFVLGLWLSVLSLFGVSAQVGTTIVATSTAVSTQQATTSQSQVLQTTQASSAQQPSQTRANTQKNASQISSQTSAQTSAGASVSLPEGGAWATTLPLGDSKYVTSGPKAGYVYVCHVTSGGEGAQGNPTWISGTVWYPLQKVAVEGSVSWPDAYYSMTISGSERIIKSNGEPTDHNTGTFPIQVSDPAHQFDGNPNSIKAQSYDFSLPVDPTMLASPDCIYGEVGIMNDGVPLFDGFDAEYRDAVAHETQDAWEGHPDQSGVYHDHGFESGPVKDPVSTVVGFAFDGYPITGSLLPDGNYLHTADLDECHGLTSTITLDGKPVTMYHYVLTQDFPYSVGCFRGKSYEPKPGAPSSGQDGSNSVQSQASRQNQQGGNPPTPPQAAITACSSSSLGTRCSFTAPQGTIPGTCLNVPNESQLVCIPTN